VGWVNVGRGGGLHGEDTIEHVSRLIKTGKRIYQSLGGAGQAECGRNSQRQINSPEAEREKMMGKNEGRGNQNFGSGPVYKWLENTVEELKKNSLTILG